MYIRCLNMTTHALACTLRLLVLADGHLSLQPPPLRQRTSEPSGKPAAAQFHANITRLMEVKPLHD